MNLESIPFAQTQLGRRVIQVVRAGVTAAQAARDTYAFQSQARSLSPDQIKAQAQGFVNNLVATGLRARTASARPHEKNLAYWQPFNQYHQLDEGLQAALRTAEARRAKTTSGAGLEITAFAPYPEITIPVINSAQRRAYTTGWTDRKVDIDSRYLMMDSHLKGAHQIRAAAPFKYKFSIRPRSSTPIGLLTAAAVKASWGHVSKFQSAMGQLGIQSATGYSCAEAVWKDTRLSIPIGKRRIAVDSEVISSFEQVLPRNIAFDITNDRPYLCMGPQSYVDITDPTLQKFLFVEAFGPGLPIRYRGFGWANSWLSYLGGLTLERFGIVIETFGVATPYLNRDGEGYLTDEEHAHAIDILENIGTGKPEVIPSRYGKLDHSPVPAGLAPLHAQMLGVVKSEQSKLVLSSTLQMEIGGVGSYAAADTHHDQQTDVQTIDLTLYAEALSTQPFMWICEANAERWASAFSRYVPGGCTPEDVIAECPNCEWVVSEETPGQRVAVYQAANGLKIEYDEEQFREETGLRAPLPKWEPVEAAAQDTGNAQDTFTVEVPE